MDLRLVLFAVLLIPSFSDGEAVSQDQRFLAGLRERGLFQLAETYCVDRLRRPDLADARRADLAIELSRCLAERAVSSPPEQRPPLWQRAQQVIDDFVRRFPQNRRLPLVQMQGALGLLTRGELARQESQVVAEGGDLAEEARANLREAVGEFGRLADEVEQLLRRQNRSPRGDPEILSADQLASLQKNVQYELARAYRNQAQCYAADSPDRANALTRAVQLLQPLAGLDPAHPLAWKSRIDTIVCYRLLADYDTARRMLDAVGKLELPPSLKLRARAEVIRLALATGRLSEAVAVISEGRQIDGVVSPELDYAWLQTYLAASRAAADAGNETQATEWQSKATDLVEQIERLHGPYWTRRAGMLLALHFRQAPQSGDLDTLVRIAESSYRSGKLDDALALYDDARAAAAKDNDAAKAFDLGYTAAAIEHNRERHDRALARYRQIATSMPGDPDASTAHLMAIYHAGQLAKKETPGAVDQYVSLLKEHLQTWPAEPSAEGVRVQLGRMYEHRQDWPNAIAIYRAVTPGNAAHQQAVEAAARCCRAWLAQRKAAGEATEQIAGNAADWFESLLVDSRGSLPERWSPLQRFAVLEAARLRLNYSTTGYAQVQQILTAALQGTADARADSKLAEWKSSARALLVFSLAGQDRRRDAANVLTQISAGPPEQLMALLEGLGRVAKEARPAVRTELAELQLRTIDLLQNGRTPLAQTQRQSLEKLRAKALADAGRSGAALQQYHALAKKYPRDGAIQEDYVELLMMQDDRSSLAAALAKSRELESRSPPQSERWFRAKYTVALLHYRLGNKQQAAKIIRLLQLLHPELGGPVLKAKFEALLKRCR